MTPPTSPDTPGSGDPTSSQPATDASADELEADIARTRDQLGDTVDLLSAKLDAKTQARQAMQGAKQRATKQVDTAKARGDQALSSIKDVTTDERGTLTPATQIGAALVVAVLAFLVVRRRRRR